MDRAVATNQPRATVWDLIDSTTATFTAAALDDVAEAWNVVHSTSCGEVMQTAQCMSVVLFRQVCLGVVMIHAWLSQHDMLESAWVGPRTDVGVQLSEACVKKVVSLSKNGVRSVRSDRSARL